TQGTVDSNEIWVDFEAKAGGRIIGRNGALSGPDDTGAVDQWSNFVNVHMLDKDGNRINRRNPQDIFTPLYNHQIPPGAAQVVHYSLEVPRDVKRPIEIRTRLRYRKFDFEYMSLVYGGDDKVPKLPIVDMCEDKITLPVADVAEDVPEQKSPIDPPWQRWNDYGIACFIEGGPGEKKGELRQAVAAFKKLLGHEKDEVKAHGYVNLARVYIDEGRLSEARDMLTKASEVNAPWWLTRWFGGLVNEQNVQLDEAQCDFEEILDPKKQERDSNFNFNKDYIVINELGTVLLRKAQQVIAEMKQKNAQIENELRNDPEHSKWSLFNKEQAELREERDDLLHQAVKRFHDTLAI